MSRELRQSGRLGRVLCSVVLPLALAGLMLAAGVLVPGCLLERKQGDYFRQTSQVAAVDIHPYGDDYGTMEQDLLQALELLRQMESGEATAYMGEEMDASQEAAFAQLQDFMSLWGQGVKDTGYVIYVLFDLLYGGSFAAAAVDQDNPDHWLLAGEAVSWEGPMSLSYVAAPRWGVPLQLDLEMSPYAYVLSPGVLWDSLTAAYQAQCGLMFNQPVAVENETAEAYDDLALPESEFLERVRRWETAECVYSAVSTDFVFRLEMRVTVYQESSGGRNWSISVALTENS